jgi:hypothetical protein
MMILAVVQWVSEESSSGLAASALTLTGVVITALLATYTAVRSSKDRKERNTDRRKIEEETTDVILKRVRRELDRAYEALDAKDDKLRIYDKFFTDNRKTLSRMGLLVPDVDIDEGPQRLRDDMRRVRVEIDGEYEDGRDEREGSRH